MTDPAVAAVPPFDAARAAAALAAFVVKRGVGLGRLTDAHRHCALAVAAAALSLDESPSEREASERLRQWLQGPAAFLDTDAAELRRWLIDTGWWTRDGFGRVYRRVPSDELPPAARPWAAALTAAAGGAESQAVARWAAGAVEAEARRRAERRAAAGAS